jgi:DNA repair exonuclease SbcCD nuclease subunit
MSKIIYATDLHLRDKRPLKRTDDYLDKQFEKLEEILEICKESNNAPFICAGDFFDTPSFSEKRRATLLELLNKYPEIEIFSIFGQHDIKHHNMRYWKESPLGSLVLSGYVTKLGNKPQKIKGWNFYGASWGEDIPIPKTEKNVLVIHELVLNEKALYVGQENPCMGSGLMKDFPEYQWFLCGDNHQTFFQETEKQTLLNAGSMMRNKIDQAQHHPCCAEVFLDHLNFEWLFLDIASENEVFDLLKEEQYKELLENTGAFIELIREAQNKKRDNDFSKVLRALAQKGGVRKEVEEEIDKIFLEIRRGE